MGGQHLSKFGQNRPCADPGIHRIVRCDGKRGWPVGNGVTKGDNLVTARNRGGRLGDRHRAGVDQNHNVESLVGRERADRVGRDAPHRRQDIGESRRNLHQIVDGRRANRECRLDRSGFVGKVGDRDLPRFGQRESEFLGVARDVCLVDEPVVRLQSIQNRRVRTQELATVRNDCFEHTTPPGELKLGGDDVSSNDSTCEYVQKTLETAFAHRIHNCAAFVNGVDARAVGSKRRNQFRHRRAGLNVETTSERAVEQRHVCHHLVKLFTKTDETRRHGRSIRRVDQSVPLSSSNARGGQRFEHVRNVSSGTHELFRELLQSATLGAGNSVVTSLGCIGRHEVVNRTVKKFGSELVQRRADPAKRVEPIPKVLERRARPERSRIEHLHGHALERRHADGVEAGGCLECRRGSFGIVKVCRRPRRSGASRLELTKVGGREKRADNLVHRGCQRDDRLDIERHFVGCIGRVGQTREFANRVQNADSETRVGLIECRPVIADDGAHSKKRGVDIHRLRDRSFFDAADRTNQIRLDGRWRRTQPIESQVAETSANVVESRSTRTGDENSFARPNKFTDRVDDGLCRARA